MALLARTAAPPACVLAAADCRANCQANPWPQLIVGCATSAIRANACTALGACTGRPVPAGFCGQFCPFAVTCHVSADPPSCLAGCAPILPPSFTTCFESA